VANATVELFRVEGSTHKLVGIVSSNNEGHYLFANLVDGDYFITASKPGFLANQSATMSLSDRTFAPLDVTIPVDPDANTGTVSGVITDSASGQALANVTVALYLISNGSETIVDITKTNAGGFYLFGDLPPATYRVKATVQTEG